MVVLARASRNFSCKTTLLQTQKYALYIYIYALYIYIYTRYKLLGFGVLLALGPSRSVDVDVVLYGF
jgi:hypothetical protein